MLNSMFTYIIYFNIYMYLYNINGQKLIQILIG